MIDFESIFSWKWDLRKSMFGEMPNLYSVFLESKNHAFLFNDFTSFLRPSRNVTPINRLNVFHLFFGVGRNNSALQFTMPQVLALKSKCIPRKNI